MYSYNKYSKPIYDYFLNYDYKNKFGIENIPDKHSTVYMKSVGVPHTNKTIGDEIVKSIKWIFEDELY